MADWQHTLDIEEIWRKSKDGEAETFEIAAVIAKKLAAIQTGDEYLDEVRDEFVSDFRDYAKDECTDTDEFDSIMERLYDWADTPLDHFWNGKKLCWVKTF